MDTKYCKYEKNKNRNLLVMQLTALKTEWKVCTPMNLLKVLRIKPFIENGNY